MRCSSCFEGNIAVDGCHICGYKADQRREGDQRQQ